MPPTTTSNGVAAAQPATTAPSKRFELPALDFKFGSLTDGTSIPPPQPSPKEEAPAPPPPKTPIKEEVPKKQDMNGAGNGHGSITGQGVSRPPSRTASTIAEERKSKRGSGWFRRLRSNDSATANKRVSQVFEEPKKPAQPPPPMIPELSALETKVDTRLGDDLFKGIK